VLLAGPGSCRGAAPIPALGPLHGGYFGPRSHNPQWPLRQVLDTTPSRAIVRSGGNAYRLKCDLLTGEFEHHPAEFAKDTLHLGPTRTAASLLCNDRL